MVKIEKKSNECNYAFMNAVCPYEKNNENSDSAFQPVCVGKRCFYFKPVDKPKAVNIEVNKPIVTESVITESIEVNKEEEFNHDAVEHPNHYCQGGIECIKAIEAAMPPEGFQDYCKGNILKYIWRWRDKAGVEDLKKAKVYLEWMIESAEKDNKND